MPKWPATVSGPLGLYPAARRGHLQLPLSWPAVAEQDHRHCARGDGQDRAGVLSAGILPREPWEQSGRWAGMGDNMFRLKDRKGADLCLGMTHEEIMTTIARNELRSYKQLPQIWYQIQTKFRDEPRPKAGLLRVRQFTMKDSYSFDIDKAGLDKSFDLHDAVYRKIFTRCGLKFVAVEADSGSMGGSQSQEFMVYTDAGEDLIASCPVCGYAANLEKGDFAAWMRWLRWSRPAMECRSWFRRRACAAIADVAEFFKISPASDIKCVAYMARKIGAGRQAGYVARRGGVFARRPPGERDQAAGRDRGERSCARCRPRS